MGKTACASTLPAPIGPPPIVPAVATGAPVANQAPHASAAAFPGSNAARAAGIHRSPGRGSRAPLKSEPARNDRADADRRTYEGPPRSAPAAAPSTPRPGGYG